SSTRACRRAIQANMPILTATMTSVTGVQRVAAFRRRSKAASTGRSAEAGGAAGAGVEPAPSPDGWAGVGPYYAMFPAEFADQVIAKHTKEGDTALDPFAGRGTAVFSAATQGRRGIGVERVSRSYWPGLFACYEVADLPRTNNDLEHFFGSHR